MNDTNSPPFVLKVSKEPTKMKDAGRNRTDLKFFRKTCPSIGDAEEAKLCSKSQNNSTMDSFTSSMQKGLNGIFTPSSFSSSLPAQLGSHQNSAFQVRNPNIARSVKSSSRSTYHADSSKCFSSPFLHINTTNKEVRWISSSNTPRDQNLARNSHNRGLCHGRGVNFHTIERVQNEEQIEDSTTLQRQPFCFPNLQNYAMNNSSSKRIFLEPRRTSVVFQNDPKRKRRETFKKYDDRLKYSFPKSAN
mmetsp:Transcript_14079/g.21049  ORF Transcript_14079/g.21049 Transcript_14079/m.21049 type:complete len:247 (-) Transcript_14079:85-825(-)